VLVLVVVLGLYSLKGPRTRTTTRTSTRGRKRGPIAQIPNLADSKDDMSSAQLDDNGVVVACPQCHQRNRIAFERLNQPLRCGKCKSDIPGVTTPIEVDTEQHFNTLIGLSQLPVLVDFWASWCGPCKMVAPEFDRLASSNVGKLIVAKVNTEVLPNIAQRYTIQAIPTMILFASGDEVQRTSGAMPAKAIQQFVDNSLRGAQV